MAEEQPGATLSTTFPPPPPFYQHFTKANVDAVEKERPDYAQRPDDTQRSTPSRAAALAYLSPPAPPSDGRYKSFGATYDINESLPSLQSQGIERLTGAAEVGARGRDAASSAWTAEQAHGLTSIAKSILLNFLELVGILSLDAAQYAPKIDHFNALFFNAHHLINEYRPHQARETLIAMMEEQLAAEEAEIAAIQSMNGRLNEVLRKLATKEAKRTRHAESAVQSGAGERRPTLAGHRPAWLALEQELGSV